MRTKNKLIIGLIIFSLMISLAQAAWWGTSTYRRPINYLSPWVTPINTSTTYTATDIDNDLTSEWIYAYNCSLNNLSIYYNTSADIKGIANGTNDECFWFQTLPTLDWKHGIAPTNLKFYMPMDNSETKVIDFSSGGHNGTISGATQGAAGKLGKAMSFDGINDYVSVDATTDLHGAAGAMTLCAWAMTDVQDYNGVIIGRLDNGDGWELGVSNAHSGVWAINIDTHITHSDVAPTVGAWTHLCAQWASDGHSHLFVNGVKQAESRTLGTTHDNGHIINIGRRFSTGVNYFDGKIDDIRFYNDDLTDAQILELYQISSITGAYESSSSPALSIDWEWDVKNTTITDSNTTACINGSVSMNSCSLFFNNSQYSNTTAGTQICFNIDNLNDTNYTSVNASCTAGDTTEIAYNQWIHVNNESQNITWDWAGVNATTYATEVSPCVLLSEYGNCTLFFNGTMIINTTVGRSICWNRQALGVGNYSSINASCDDYAYTETNSSNTWLNVITGSCATPIDNLMITSNTVLCNGQFSLDDDGKDSLLWVHGDNINVRGNGTIIKQMNSTNHTTIFAFSPSHSGITIENLTLEANATAGGRGYYFSFGKNVYANITNITTNGTGATLLYAWDDGTHVNFKNCSLDHTNPTYGEIGNANSDKFVPACPPDGMCILGSGGMGYIGMANIRGYFINTTMTTNGKYDSTNYTGFSTSSYFYHQWWHNANVTNAGVANVSVYTFGGTKLYSDDSSGGETSSYLVTTARVTGDYDAGEPTPEGQGYTIWYAPLQVIAFINNTVSENTTSLVGNNQTNLTLNTPFSVINPTTPNGSNAASYLTVNLTSNFTMNTAYIEIGGTNYSMTINDEGTKAGLVQGIPAFGINTYQMWGESDLISGLWFYTGTYNVNNVGIAAGGGGGGGAPGTLAGDNFVLYRPGGEAPCIGQDFCYNSVTYDSTTGTYEPLKLKTCSNRVLAARDGLYTVCNLADHESKLDLKIDGYSTSYGTTDSFLSLNTTELTLANSSCKSFQVKPKYPSGAIGIFSNTPTHDFSITISGVEKEIVIVVEEMKADCPAIETVLFENVCVGEICAPPTVWFLGIFFLVVIFLVNRR